MPATAAQPTDARHARWVRSAHWLVTLSFLTLAFSGFVILLSHPRLYWGEAGNDLTPPLFEFPISRNYKHGGWAPSAPFFQDAASPVSASRTYDILNENGWGRSLHFPGAVRGRSRGDGGPLWIQAPDARDDRGPVA